MKTIFITEKPSVARAFCKVLGLGASEKKDGYYENDEYIITYALGHLVTLCYPEQYDEKYKKWSLDTIPFLPNPYKYMVIPEGGAKKQFEIIKKLYHRTDVRKIYLCPDPAREGVNIQYSIAKMAGLPDSIEQKVVWIDSQTDEEIRRGIAEAKPRSEYDLLAAAGRMRAIEDYATGINLSRALSLKYANLINEKAGKKKSALPVGRVMSCVLGMVVRRERLIRSFTPTPFFRVFATIPGGAEFEWHDTEESAYHNSTELYENKGFRNSDTAEAFIKSMAGQQFEVAQIKIDTERKFAKTLYNLAELQNEGSKVLKISPDQTLAIAQTLYERRLITYPRTDSRYLSSAIAKEIVNNLVCLELIPEVAAHVAKIREMGSFQTIGSSKYTNDAKVTDHYAIIPTGDVRALDSLNEMEMSVYMMIVRRFLAIFFPPAVYNAVKASIKCGTEEFTLSKKQLKDKGYMVVLDDDSECEEDKALAAVMQLKQGDLVAADLSVKEGETQPPKRYTSGSIILAMENAGNLIEEEELREQIKTSGIGTSATRGDILAKLFKNGHLHLNKKTQVITPEPYGEMIYDAIDLTIPSFLEPKITASWEKGLDQVASGAISESRYLQQVHMYVAKEVNSIKESDISAALLEKIANIETAELPGAKIATLPCPKCYKPLRMNKRGDICCTSYTKGGGGCGFYMYGSYFKKKLTETQLFHLLRDGSAKNVALENKEGKKYKGDLILDENFKICLDTSKFGGAEEEVGHTPSSITCPDCNSATYRTNLNIRCEKCGFKMKHSVSGHQFDDASLYLLLNGDTLTVDGLLSKKGKPYTASVKLDKDRKFELIFPDGGMKKKRGRKESLWK